MLIENEILQVKINEKNGCFESIFRKKINREFLDSWRKGNLFRLIVPSQKLTDRYADACRQKISYIREDKGAVVIRYDEVETCDGEVLAIEVEVKMSLDGESIVAQMSLRNNSEAVIEDVQFPQLCGLDRIGNDGKDALIFPAAQGTGRQMVKDPFNRLGGNHVGWYRDGQKMVMRYPFQLVTAWMDYCNNNMGVGIDIRHEDFQLMDFAIDKGVLKKGEDNSVCADLLLTCIFYPHLKKGKTWSSPEGRLTMHEGDWHVVADQHRDWLEPRIKMPDTPESFAKSLGWLLFLMKLEDGRIVNTYKDIPGMAEAALEAGIPNILLFGWHKSGHNRAAIHYHYPNEELGGEESLRKNIKKAEDLGCRVVPFFATAGTDTETPEHKESAYKWEIKSREGAPLFHGNWAIYNYDFQGYQRASHWHDICPCKEMIEYFLKSIRRMISIYGFRNIQLDQIAHKMFLCYNPEHHHERPDLVFTDGLGKFMKETRKMIREVNPEGVIIAEGYTDFVMQYCDASWNWSQLDFPEPMVYSLPWRPTSHEIDGLEFAEVNECFAYKHMLDLKIDGGEALITKYPHFVKHVRKIAELKKACSEYYTCAYFRDQEGIIQNYPEGRDKVIIKTFRQPKNNKRCIVIGNITDKEQKASFNYTLSPRPIKAIRFSSEGTREDIKMGNEMSLNLLPYEVVVIGIALLQKMEV